MSSKSTSLVIAGLVVVAAIVFFNSRNTSTPNGDDLTGAIGTVDKYHSEQIQSTDVVLEGFDPAESARIVEEWLGEEATMEEMAGLLGRTSAQERSIMPVSYTHLTLPTIYSV